MDPEGQCRSGGKGTGSERGRGVEEVGGEEMDGGNRNIGGEKREKEELLRKTCRRPDYLSPGNGEQRPRKGLVRKDSRYVVSAVLTSLTDVWTV